MFYNDSVIVDQYGFLPLQAYGELANENWRFAGGLQFDVFCPGIPTVLPFRLCPDREMLETPFVVSCDWSVSCIRPTIASGQCKWRSVNRSHDDRPGFAASVKTTGGPT